MIPMEQPLERGATYEATFHVAGWAPFSRVTNLLKSEAWDVLPRIQCTYLSGDADLDSRTFTLRFRYDGTNAKAIPLLAVVAVGAILAIAGALAIALTFKELRKLTTIGNVNVGPIVILGIIGLVAYSMIRRGAA